MEKGWVRPSAHLSTYFTFFQPRQHGLGCQRCQSRSHCHFRCSIMGLLPATEGPLLTWEAGNQTVWAWCVAMWLMGRCFFTRFSSSFLFVSCWSHLVTNKLLSRGSWPYYERSVRMLRVTSPGLLAFRTNESGGNSDYERHKNSLRTGSWSGGAIDLILDVMTKRPPLRSPRDTSLESSVESGAPQG